MSMGFAPTWLRQLSPPPLPPASHDHFNHCHYLHIQTYPVWWRSVTLCWRSKHAISSYRGNRPTKPETRTQRPPARCKDRTDNESSRDRACVYSRAEKELHLAYDAVNKGGDYTILIFISVSVFRWIGLMMMIIIINNYI